MAHRDESTGITAKAAGLKVKSMIEAVEQKMADGEKVSAGPTSEQEVQALNLIKDENKKSGERSRNA